MSEDTPACLQNIELLVENKQSHVNYHQIQKETKKIEPANPFTRILASEK